MNSCRPAPSCNATRPLWSAGSSVGKLWLVAFDRSFCSPGRGERVPDRGGEREQSVQRGLRFQQPPEPDEHWHGAHDEPVIGSVAENVGNVERNEPLYGTDAQIT